MCVPTADKPDFWTASVIVTLIVGLLTFLAALTAAYMSYKASKSASESTEQAGQRAEWWRRFERSILLAIEDKALHAELGMRMIRHLSASHLADDEDHALADAVTQLFLPPVEELNDEEVDELVIVVSDEGSIDAFEENDDRAESGPNQPVASEQVHTGADTLLGRISAWRTRT